MTRGPESPAAPNPAEAEIRRRIAERGSIPFVEFMEIALYHPDGGYYTRAVMTTGAGGDFSTSSDVSPAFGRRIAVQIAELHARIRDATGEEGFELVEIGPGRGLLAADLLEGLAHHAPESLAALSRLTLVEISPALRERQRQRLASWGGRVPLRWVSRIDELEGERLRGIVYANELLDALPVRLFARREAGLCERYVTVGASESLVFTDDVPLDATDARLVEHYRLCPGAGDEAELAPGLAPLMERLGALFEIGAALFIDYGHTAERLGDEDHASGTLLAYHEHRIETDLLVRPGRQDLTAHVNWTHLEDAARAAGFEVAGRTSQERFLVALGLIEDLVAPSDPRDETPTQAQERLAARALIMPGAGGGHRFEFTLLSKGLAGPFRGLLEVARL